jgi:hypothetical protein
MSMNCAFTISPLLPVIVIVHIPPTALDFTVNVQAPILPPDTGQVGLGMIHKSPAGEPAAFVSVTVLSSEFQPPLGLVTVIVVPVVPTVGENAMLGPPVITNCASADGGAPPASVTVMK